MKQLFFSTALACLSVSPMAQAICTYDVAPIRTFFNALAAEAEYLGPEVSDERDASGAVTHREREGIYNIRAVGVDTWEFNGDFCTDSICESTFAQYNIADGCLRSFDTPLTVTTGTSTEVAYSLERDGLRLKRRLKRGTTPVSLKIWDEIWDGKVWVYKSVFRGGPTL